MIVHRTLQPHLLWGGFFSFSYALKWVYMSTNINRLTALKAATQISFSAVFSRGDCTYIYKVSEDQKTM